jgi:hypothetical protein
MKKFLTLLFAFTCLAFSEMRGQIFFRYFSDGFSNMTTIEMTSSDGINFSYSGVIDVNGVDGNLLGLFRAENNGSFLFERLIYNFPSGTATDYNGTFFSYIITPGNYLIRYNKNTHEYSFVGGNYQTFDDSGIWISSCNKLSVYLNTSFNNFKWKRNGEIIPGANSSEYIHPSTLPEGNYNYTCEAFSPDSGAVLSSNVISLSNPIPVTAQFQNANDFCSNRQFSATINQPGSGWSYQWKKDGQAISGANQSAYNSAPQTQNATYTCLASCPNNNASKESNSLAVPGCFGDSTSGINYLLVQNVTTTGNNAGNKTIQVQFDLSWGNTWWDDINWDAAWVFMKYKTASGEWKHAKINPSGYDHGQGSPNIIQPTADKMGAFIRLGLKGQGNFNAEGMQLQWNYGLDGLNSVNGLEVKVFATEMVYQPQGDFTISTAFRSSVASSGNYDENPNNIQDYKLAAPGNNLPVINSRLGPNLSGPGISMKIKGDAGFDLDSNGTIDVTNYPTGFYPFYIFKYEMSEQAFADFLNCLSPGQVSNLGIPGTSINLNQSQYFAASPNRACKGGNAQRLLSYADWSGLRPATFLELQKAYNGPNYPNNPFGFNYSTGSFFYLPKESAMIDFNNGAPLDANGNQGRGLYGAKDLIGNVWEPFIDLGSTTFLPINGNGSISTSGTHDQNGWFDNQLRWGNFTPYNSEPGPSNYYPCEIFVLNGGGYYQVRQCYGEWGFRLCRSAE